ncbi:MAG TPA: urate hydroxylase PuuD [Croceibacterium sp.]|nr:urate hydroxylase PuuD [Croceibacterium sp.]
MAKFFGNLHLVLATGLVLAIVVIACFTDWTGSDPRSIVDDVFRWLHLFFGVTWIGLLYYFNFVQVPTMPKVPAELKKGVTGFIAPSALFFFRWGAAFTVLTGLIIAFHNGYGADALTFQGNGADGINLIGIGMWLALIMAFNVWFIIWPNQKKILGLVEASDEAKAKAAPVALVASRLNVLLSLPMAYCMVSANLG